MRWALLCLLAALSIGSVAVMMIGQSLTVPFVEKQSTHENTGQPRSFTIPRDSRGHFKVDAVIDGRRFDFLVDTGASTIALKESEAKKLGLNPAKAEFTVNVRTAKGTVTAAPVNLSSVDVGGIVVRDVRALIVSDDALEVNLLGLSFLTKLKKFEYKDGKLNLEQ